MTTKFLPALDQSLQPPAPNTDDSWANHNGGLTVLAKYSGALAVSSAEVAPERLKSVPSPWARVLLFEQALFNRRHPAHRATVKEWRGLLGAIALAPHLRLSLSTKLVDLTGRRDILGSLRDMAPQGDRAEIWDYIALIYLDDQLAGGTSPRTLVFSGIRGLSTGRVPFQTNGRLTDPTGYYEERRDRLSLTMLLEWLEAMIVGFESPAGLADLDRLLGRLPTGAGTGEGPGQDVGTSRSSLLIAEFKTWREETRAAVEAVGRQPAPVVDAMRASPLGRAFPQGHPAEAALARILQVQPAAGAVEANDLQVRDTSMVASLGRTGLLTTDTHPFTGTVALPHGMARQVSKGRFLLPTSAEEIGATLPDLGEFFESKLIPVRGVVRDSAQALDVGGQAYLYPFRGEILNHIQPEQLAAWTRISGQHATGLSVRLELPVAAGRKVSFERLFVGGDVYDQNAVAAPSIAAWPDFESESWQHYFYIQRQAGHGGLDMVPWGTAPLDTYEERGIRWAKFARPASAWVGTYAGAHGLLVTRPGRQANSSGVSWDISIDFGSTNTRVFRSVIGVGGALTTAEVVLTPRTKMVLGEDKSMPYNFFVTADTLGGPASEPPSLIWLPLERSLEREQSPSWLPPEGVMFWGAVELAPTTAGLRGNLKWHRDDRHERAAFHSYASQLYLSIAAEAAASGAHVGSLITAYPSVLPLQLRTRHRAEWRELQARFDVTVKEPRAESDAVASFFVAQGAMPQSNLLAVDVGGSTSDIAVWMQGVLSQGDSIRLAGDLLSRLVANDKAAREAFSSALSRPPFNYRGVHWDEDDTSKNGMLLNSVLRTLSQQRALREEPDALAKNLFDGPGSPGERVLAHLGYLFAATSYVLGLMVRRVNRPQDRYDIRFAGKGAMFLHWLDALATNASQTLPSAFFRAALGEAANGAEVNVVLPGSSAKQEVGRGLLLPSLGPPHGFDDRETFVGETGLTTSSGELSWSDALHFTTLQSVTRPTEPIPLEKLQSLKSFIAAFENDPAAKKTARALGIDRVARTRELRDRIHQRVFGAHSVWQDVHAPAGGRQTTSLLEPIFVTEAKALLEQATGNFALFGDG